MMTPALAPWASAFERALVRREGGGDGGVGLGQAGWEVIGAKRGAYLRQNSVKFRDGLQQETGVWRL